jgi:hypothetical protein
VVEPLRNFLERGPGFIGWRKSLGAGAGSLEQRIADPIFQ